LVRLLLFALIGNGGHAVATFAALSLMRHITAPQVGPSLLLPGVAGTGEMWNSAPDDCSCNSGRW
jgi:hypothetical protein